MGDTQIIVSHGFSLNKEQVCVQGAGSKPDRAHPIGLALERNAAL
jgi:hypothetical protein